MIGFRELLDGFRHLGLDPDHPVIVHAALSSFGEQIRGGAETVLGALLVTAGRVMAPTFTYKTMVNPGSGPEFNAMKYNRAASENRSAQTYTSDMPAAGAMGLLPETIRRHPGAKRSMHPILSFSAVGLDDALAAQTLDDPLTPILQLAEMGGEVLLIGVDQRSNTSIHAAEKLAGRRQFVRWALTSSGVTPCQGFPGCSEGFNQLEPALEPFSRRVRVHGAELQAIPLQPLLATVVGLLRVQPLALLCDDPACERCGVVRLVVSQTT